MTNKAEFIKTITDYVAKNPGCIINKFVPLADQVRPEFAKDVSTLRLVEIFAANPNVWDICTVYEDNGKNDGGTFEDETWDGVTERCRMFNVVDFDFLEWAEIYELRCDVYTDVNDQILRLEFVPD